jgi:hypothetical protein
MIKKFVVLALLGLISHTEAIRLLEEPPAVAVAVAANPAEVAPVTLAAPTEEEFKAKAIAEAEAKEAQEAANLKASKNMNEENEKALAKIEADKSDFDKYMNSIATTTHKDSKEFDYMHTEMYKRDMDTFRKAKDDKLIEKGITPPGSIATKDDEDLSEAQKVLKAQMITLIQANKKALEDKDKAYWDKVNSSGEEWAGEMPEKFLQGP